MLLLKTSLWLISYPLMLTTFAVRISLQTLSFLFHSPVDTWTIIGKVVEAANKESQ